MWNNWKTTVIGIVLLIGAVVLFIYDRPVEAGMCLTASIGFFSAKDNDVTGGTRTQPS